MSKLVSQTAKGSAVLPNLNNSIANCAYGAKNILNENINFMSKEISILRKALELAALRYARGIGGCPREIILPRPACILETCPTEPFEKCWVAYFLSKAEEKK